MTSAATSILLRNLLSVHGELSPKDQLEVKNLPALQEPLTKDQLRELRLSMTPRVYHHVCVAWHRNSVYWMDIAAAVGRLEWLDWLHHHGFICSTLALDLAAACGSLVCVQYLHKHRTEGGTTLAMDMAARYGHLEIVRYLHNNRMEGCTSDAMYYAAKYGFEDIVRFLCNERFNESASTRALDFAARHGHYGIVQMLHAAFSVSPHLNAATTSAMDMAAAHGHLYVVCFLHEHRTEGCTSEALVLASARGHFDVIRFLCENRNEGCLTAALEVALERNHSDVASYLISILDSQQSACSQIGCRLLCRKKWHKSVENYIFMTTRSAFKFADSTSGGVDLSGPSTYDSYHHGSSTSDLSLLDDIDPSLAGGYRVVYDRETPFELRIQDSDNAPQQVGTLEAIKVKILLHGDENDIKSLKIELSTETDLFFYYVHLCDIEGFHLIQEQQKLMVDFSDYSNVLIRMLNNCIKEPHNYIAVYLMQSDGRARLDFIQNMEYKFIELLSVDFTRSPDEIIRQHITYRYNSIKNRVTALQSRLHEVNNLVKVKNPSLLLQLQKGSQPAIHPRDTIGISSKHRFHS